MNELRLNNIDFENNIKNSIIKEFDNYDQEVDASIGLVDLMHSYINWRKRFIGYGRREVIMSDELRNNPLYKKNKKLQKAVNKLAYKFKNAEDLTPFLSKGVVDYPVNDAKKRDIDLMLNAFSIHHFHLGNEREKTKKQGINFTKRRDELLFTWVDKDKVYFINIYPHEFPYKEDIFKIIQNNWEYLIKPFEMQGISGIDHYSEDTTKQLLNAHLNSSIEINGKFYIVSGIALSGHSIDWTRNIYGLFDQINKCENALFLNKHKILFELNSKLRLNLTDINLQIVIENGMLFFLETQSKKCIVVDSALNYIITNDACSIGNHSFDLNS
ncbi:hypothetical protein [Sulfurimonas microaerophilic]|uniref:hypothetical protein n=1 Tax=Sulfurimonas microaerophilic TaxID=3058392 RepID=UPI0027153805|nr:hypothetical protein [Sulfurimonas sp. hsl 1-7]